MANLKQYELEINGTLYKAQFNGLAAAMDAADTCKVKVEGELVQSMRKMTDYILRNVIVEPAGLKIDDFEDSDVLAEVVKFGSKVMNGKFQPSKEQGPA